jgi:RNA polymerase sigma factor (TIGR02999 family)
VHDITLMLQAAQRDEPGAADQLMEAVYAELRELAATRLAGERNNVTLQPTALVHEAWLRLGGDQQTPWRNRAHFFSAAAEAMRRILIDRARNRGRMRRGGGLRPLSLDDVDEPAAAAEAEHVLAVNDALVRLAATDPARAEFVKLRYFTGLTLEETAQILGISESTAKRRWTFARAWLVREIRRS